VDGGGREESCTGRRKKMARWMRKEGKFCTQKEIDGGRSEEPYR